MAHVRQSIRDNVVTAVTGLSTTGSNVFRLRVYPLGTNKLPAMSVYTDSKVVEYNRLDRVRDVDRTVDIVIDACVRVVLANGRPKRIIRVQIAKRMMCSI